MYVEKKRPSEWTYKQLTSEERGKIEAYLDEGLSQAEIARRLDRHPSTISREIRRNSEERKADSLAALRYQASSADNWGQRTN